MSPLWGRPVAPILKRHGRFTYVYVLARGGGRGGGGGWSDYDVPAGMTQSTAMLHAAVRAAQKGTELRCISCVRAALCGRPNTSRGARGVAGGAGTLGLGGSPAAAALRPARPGRSPGRCAPAASLASEGAFQDQRRANGCVAHLLLLLSRCWCFCPVDQSSEVRLRSTRSMMAAYVH